MVWSWPSLLLAAPAATEVWSAWIGITQKTRSASYPAGASLGSG